jgi:hypothetical protein
MKIMQALCTEQVSNYQTLTYNRNFVNMFSSHQNLSDANTHP